MIFRVSFFFSFFPFVSFSFIHPHCRAVCLTNELQNIITQWHFCLTKESTRRSAVSTIPSPYTFKTIVRSTYSVHTTHLANPSMSRNVDVQYMFVSYYIVTVWQTANGIACIRLIVFFFGLSRRQNY